MRVIRLLIVDLLESTVIAMMPIPEVVAIASVVVMAEEEDDVTDSPVEAMHRTAGYMYRSVAE